ncbi:MAG TPA: cystathionine gamma-synthase [Draconibacterium sp.]|nr:cystathionine gamma-synthase [Draconibacterium sp.]
MKFSTKAIHAGQEPDKETGSVVVPIYQTSTYKQDEVNVYKGFEYSRSGNPTRQALEECLAALENGRFSLAFSSGLAAEHAVLSTLKPGDHVVAAEDMYGGTYRLFEQVFKPYGLQFTYVKGNNNDFEQAIKPETKLFWIESPTNPLLRIIDISGVSTIAHKKNIKVVTDNTFASPYFQQPLLLGADLVVHSTTKYIGGHSDLIGGALIVNDEEWYAELKFLQYAIGAIPGAFDSWLMLRGIKTLSVRMKQHEENALKIAGFLESHPAISQVYYPGLSSNPFHTLAKQQMTGFGGMISFKLNQGDEKASNSFFKKLKIISLAESLGGVESLICYPSAMTHGSIPEKQRNAIGVTKDLIRISVGIEDVEDLIEDLSVGLNY